MAQTGQFSMSQEPEKATSSENPNSTTDPIQNLLDNTDSEGNYNPKITDPTLNEIKKYTTKKDPYYTSSSSGSIKEMGKYTNY